MYGWIVPGGLSAPAATLLGLSVIRMTLKDCTVVEAETYDELLQALSLQHTFETVHGTSLEAFDTDTVGVLPVTVVLETLDAAEEDYWFDAPRTGSEPRFRVVELP